MPSPASQYLLVRTADRLCALPLAQVVEVLRPPALAVAERTAAGQVGFAQLRGQLVAVFELSTLLGLPGPADRSSDDLGPGADAGQDEPAEHPRRAVSTRLGDSPQPALLLVDSVSGIGTLEPDSLSRIDLPGGSERRHGRLDQGFAQLAAVSGFVLEPAQAAHAAKGPQPALTAEPA